VTGRLVVITGAGSGIGRATALAFARQGAEVVIADLHSCTAQQTAELVGRRGHAYQVDVADGAAMLGFADRVLAEHGVPDVLVNNAGISHGGGVLDTSTEQWRRVLGVNLWGVIHGCRVFGEPMVSRGAGGHIVNVASGAAFSPSKALGAYATSKAAVLMLSDCLRPELAAARIGVSTICPGLIDTNITRTMTFSGTDSARRRARTIRLHTLRHFGPERVAETILLAVRHKRAVVPVTAEARMALLLSRFSPGVSRALARIEAM
jgi:NAD(P)-dependent dehydrogenase (short-subunit alcohol dehydrogenase family)